MTLLTGSTKQETALKTPNYSILQHTTNLMQTFLVCW